MAHDSESHPQIRYFDGMADLFERYAEITDGEIRPWLAEVIPDRSGRGSRAVDLGCGNGRFTGLLADRYDKVLAVDIAERQVEIARATRDRPNITYEHRDMRKVTPERDGRFGLVLSVNTITQLRDYDNALRQVRGLVAPGGHAVVVDIVHDHPWWNARWWQYAEGMRVSARALVRRRSVADSVDVLRLRWHPTWLKLVTTHTPLSRDEFHRLYGTVFPGATFADHLHRVMCGMRWRAPQAEGPAGTSAAHSSIVSDIRSPHPTPQPPR
jgi:SAM-dependent methyltransferase